jgi:carbonic anhydrase
MPIQTLQRLLDGNRRYMLNKSTLDESERRRIGTAREGQHPVAMIFSCVDARVPPELVFDQGLGDLFVIRTAGQVLDRAVLGSIEFGAAELHIPILMVLGHESCGAVQVALDVIRRGDEAQAEMEYLVEALEPALARGLMRGDDDLWEAAGRAQVQIQVEQLREVPILASAVARGELGIVGAWYHLESGLVEITVE